jgi:hypothetical protein
MSELASPVGDAIRDLETSAREKGVEVHRSFFVELENYARHEGVRELPPRDLQRALVGIGEGALGHGGGRVGGGAVRLRIAELCNDPFSACDLAARRVLGDLAVEPGGAHGGGGSGRVSRILRELPDDPFSVR